jgi:hypothetical protein
MGVFNRGNRGSDNEQKNLPLRGGFWLVNQGFLGSSPFSVGGGGMAFILVEELFVVAEELKW